MENLALWNKYRGISRKLQPKTSPRNRRTVDIAGPERLYQRVTRMRASQLQRLASRRRASFSEGDFAARVDKSRSAEDLKWAEKLGRYMGGLRKRVRQISAVLRSKSAWRASSLGFKSKRKLLFPRMSRGCVRRRLM